LQEFLHVVLEDDDGMTVKTGSLGAFAFDNLEEHVSRAILLNVEKIRSVVESYLGRE
jgi:hypothetical protein